MKMTRNKAEKTIANGASEETLVAMLNHPNKHVRYKAARRLGLVNVSPRTMRAALHGLSWLLRLPERRAQLDALSATSPMGEDHLNRIDVEKNSLRALISTLAA